MNIWIIPITFILFCTYVYLRFCKRRSEYRCKLTNVQTLLNKILKNITLLNLSGTQIVTDYTAISTRFEENYSYERPDGYTDLLDELNQIEKEGRVINSALTIFLEIESYCNEIEAIATKNTGDFEIKHGRTRAVQLSKAANKLISASGYSDLTQGLRQIKEETQRHHNLVTMQKKLKA